MSRTALLRGATRVLQRITTRPTVSSSQCLQSHTLLSPCCARCASTGAGADTHPFVSQLVDDQDKRAKAAEVRARASLKAPSTTALGNCVGGRTKGRCCVRVGCGVCVTGGVLPQGGREAAAQAA